MLLLIQLRPLAAGVVCLEQTMGSDECAMPAHAAAVSPPGEAPSVPHACPDAVLCSPAGVAVLQSAINLPAPDEPVALQLGLVPASPGGPALAPPFHPPRA
ncbi:MAG: hypothetical protein ACREOC_12430 [Gemmatimonadales bacterium]